jgi:hypothetical protein
MKFKFSIMGIVLMVIAIVAGQYLGTFLTPYLGSLSGGITGALLIGVLSFFVFALLTGTKMTIMGAIIFAVLIYAANMIAAYIAGTFGFGSGVITLVLTSSLASILWGWFGAKGKSSRLRV